MKQLHADVITIHDEVMPEMMSYHRIKKNIRKDTAQYQLTSEDLKMLDKISQAEDAMMNWMYEFKQPDLENYSDEIMKYLASEKEKITLVKSQMLEVLSDAKRHIGE